MIKQYFFYTMAILIPLGFLSWFSWLLGKALLGMYEDWQLGRELDQLQAESEQRRRNRAEANLQRLSTGCDHDFTTGGHGLPPNTCRHCGLEQEKPSGPCDHRWQMTSGATPASVCEKCGRKYSSAETRQQA